MKKNTQFIKNNLFLLLQRNKLQNLLIYLLMLFSFSGGVISCAGNDVQCLALLVPSTVTINMSIKTLSTSILWPEDLILKVNGLSVFNSCLLRNDPELRARSSWLSSKIDDHNLSVVYSSTRGDETDLQDFKFEIFRLENCETGSSETLIYEVKSLHVYYEEMNRAVCGTSNTSLSGKLNLETTLLK